MNTPHSSGVAAFVYTLAFIVGFIVFKLDLIAGTIMSLGGLYGMVILCSIPLRGNLSTLFLYVVAIGFIFAKPIMNSEVSMAFTAVPLLVCTFTAFLILLFKRNLGLLRRQVSNFQTELKEKVNVLKEQESNIRFIIESISDYSIISLNETGEIVSWNSGAVELFNKYLFEVKGKKLWDVIQIESDGFKWEDIKSTLNADKRFSKDFRVFANGRKFQANFNFSLLSGKSGDLAFSLVIRDLTESSWQAEAIAYKKYSDMLLAQKMDFEQLNFAASHHLQEPLRTIKTYTEFLKQEKVDKLSEVQQKSLQFMYSASDRLADLIHKLMHFSSLSSEITYETIDLNDLVDEVHTRIQVQHPSFTIELKKTKLPFLSANRLQLEDVFYELFTNAVKFSKDELVKIELSYREDEVIHFFSITDNGIGFNQGQEEKAFDLFQKCHHSAAYDGLGYGLTAVKKIIDNHRGQV